MGDHQGQENAILCSNFIFLGHPREFFLAPCCDLLKQGLDPHHEGFLAGLLCIWAGSSTKDLGVDDNLNICPPRCNRSGYSYGILTSTTSSSSSSWIVVRGGAGTRSTPSRLTYCRWASSPGRGRGALNTPYTCRTSWPSNFPHGDTGNAGQIFVKHRINSSTVSRRRSWRGSSRWGRRQIFSLPRRLVRRDSRWVTI